MHILIGLALVAGLIVFWVGGHWWARVLMFLVLATPGAVITAGSVVTGPVAFLVGVCLLVLAWFGAALPTYYWHHRIRQMLRPQERPPGPVTSQRQNDEREEHLLRQWYRREFG